MQNVGSSYPEVGCSPIQGGRHREMPQAPITYPSRPLLILWPTSGGFGLGGGGEVMNTCKPTIDGRWRKDVVGRGRELSARMMTIFLLAARFLPAVPYLSYLPTYLPKVPEYCLRANGNYPFGYLFVAISTASPSMRHGQIGRAHV